MGRYYFDKKTEVEDCKRVDVFWLKKHGYLSTFKSGGISWQIQGENHSIGVEGNVCDPENEYVRIFYTNTNINGEKRSFDYKVPLTRTNCYFGGFRYWFICPMYRSGMYCGRRVGTMYKNGNYFACRRCYNLTYRVRNENRKSQFFGLFRMLYFEDKIEKMRSEIKFSSYKGKPTRKHRQYLKLLHRINQV